jgi:hypothetical protein
MNVLSDICLVASNDSKAPSGSEGYTPIGCWNVDDGGSHSTGGTESNHMMALYAEFIEVDCLDDAYPSV